MAARISCAGGERDSRDATAIPGRATFALRAPPLTFADPYRASFTFALSDRSPAARPSFAHISSTRFLVSASISISFGQLRVNPSSGHFRVASMPIFDPYVNALLE